MFNKDTWQNLTKDVAELWEKLENTLSLRINIELMRDISSDVNKWRMNALKRVNKVSNIALQLVKKEKPKIDNATQKMLVIAYMKANNIIDDIDNELESLGKGNVNVVVAEEMKVSLEKMQQFNDKEYLRLINETPQRVQRLINDVKLNYDILAMKTDEFENRRVSKNLLYKSIYNQTQKAIEDGYKITYIDGKKFSFKSYMEMNVRTTVQNEALSYMEIGSNAIGVEMYLASSHSDCADDHVNWQGKIYIGDNTIDRWNGKYKRISEAKRNGFATRPNCRHYFIPITEEQLREKGIKGLHKELKTEKGKYNPKQAEALKRQRLCERNIRKYKGRVANSEALLNTKGLGPQEKDEALLRIKHNKALLEKWRATNRNIVAANDLKRDYRRESSKVIVQDLGVKYHLSYQAKTV